MSVAVVRIKDVDAGTKLVSRLYSIHTIKNNYSFLRLGADRIMVVPNRAQTESISL